MSPEKSLHHTDTHKHSAVASRQNFQTAQKIKKTKILKSTQNQKNWNFRNPRVSSDLPKYPKTTFLTKIGNFQNRQKSSDEPLPYMVGWVGYWHPQAQRRSLPPKFSDRQKIKKNKILKSTQNRKNWNFQNPRVSSDLQKYPKTKFLTKIRNFQNHQKSHFLIEDWGFAGI